MQRLGLSLALIPMLVACGAEPAVPPVPGPAIVARALEPTEPSPTPGDAIDEMPIEAPAQLPSLEVVGAPSALGLEALDVKVTVQGRLARTEVTQVFRNMLPRVVEGSYRMTLPDAAVISRLAMDVEGVMTEGELVEKERARRIYDDIVRSQKDPALLEWQGGNRFTMQVFPIPASGTKTIVLAYEELLPVRGRRVQYAYGLPALADGRTSRIGRFSFSLAATECGAPALERDAAGYPARVGETGVWYEEIDFAPRGALRVSFPRPQPGSATVVAGVVGEADGPEQAFLVDVVPDLPDATRPAPRDLVLVLDTSRGIGDRELSRAAAVARALAARRTGARVVIVTGDLDVQTCAAGADACLGGGLSAGGATDLEALLGAAAQAASGLERPAVVLFSDGVATVGELDGDVLRARFLEQLDAERTAVFTVAIGREPDADFLAALANAGRGHPLRLTPAGSVDGAVESLAHLLSVPLFLDVTAEVIDGDAEWVALPPVHLRPGEPLALYGRTDGAPFTVAVRGRWNDDDFETAVRVEPGVASSDRLVAHFWARASIEALERRGAPRQEMVALSLRHGVMSRATSFLVLENEQAFRRFGVERRRHTELAADGNKNLEKGTGPLQELLGAKHDDGRLGSELATALPSATNMGNLQGLDVGGHGLGLRGAGGGGIAGDKKLSTLGTGKVGTRGRGTGEAGYGSGGGGLGGRSDRGVTTTQGSPVILGSIDKEIIRRVVQAHLSQIRYCYEKELTRTPGIFGKVVMKWVINGEGVVTQAQTAETQLRNANVEGCIARGIKTWRFPKPAGGGIVIVNHPFVFKQGDGGAGWSAPPRDFEPAPPPPPPPPPRPRAITDVVAERRDNLLDLRLLLEEVRAREAAGDQDGARRTLSEVVELAPHDPARRQLYADELLARRQLNDACEELGHVTSLQPARRDLFRTMMGLRRRGGADASALKSCIVDGVSRLPVQRALSLVLTWEDSSADVDLHVIGPNGEHVSFQHREGKDGGLLYYDVTDGYGPEIYTLGQANKGSYRLGVVHYAGPDKGVRGTLTIIEDAGTPAERRRFLPFRLGAADHDDVRTLAEVRL